MLPADVQDRDGAKGVLEKAKGRFRSLRLISADGGYAGALIEWVMPVAPNPVGAIARFAAINMFPRASSSELSATARSR